MPSNQPRKAKTLKPKTEETALETQPKAEKHKSAPNALVRLGARYSEPDWMVRWLNAAADAEDMADACEKSGKTITDYLKARIADPEFDAACLVFDQIVELRIIDTIRRQAEEGTVPAQGMYFKSVRRPSFGPDFASWNALPPPPAPSTPMPVEVADAMIKAGLEAFEKLNRPSELDPHLLDDRPQLSGPADTE